MIKRTRSVLIKKDLQLNLYFIQTISNKQEQGTMAAEVISLSAVHFRMKISNNSEIFGDFIIWITKIIIRRYDDNKAR